MLGHAADGAASGDVIGDPEGRMLVVVDPKGLRCDGTDAEFAGAVRGAARRAHGACCARLGLRAGRPRSPG